MHRTATDVARSGRDRGIDLLRALALGRVFLWHATGWAVVTWIAAIPVMVFVTGLMLARSMRSRSTVAVVRDRLRRILIPLWAYAAVAWTVMIGVELAAGRTIPWRRLPAWVLPLNDPAGTEWSGGWLAEPLWYLRLLVWMMLALPLLVRAARRAPVAAIGCCVTATVLAEVTLGTAAWPAQDMVMYSTFLVAGLATGSGRFRQLGPTWGWLLPAGAVGSVSWLLLHGVDSPVVNDSHTLHLTVGVATLGVSGLTLGVLRRAADRFSRTVDLVSQRSLSIYLWHCAAIASVMALTEPWRASTGGGVTGRLLIVVGSGALTSAFVWIAGPVEDRAAGRRATRPSARRALAPGIVTVSVSLVLFVAAPSVTGQAFVLPAPSQAPERPDYLQAPRSGRIPGTTTLPDRATDVDDVGLVAVERVPRFDHLAPLVTRATAGRLDRTLGEFADEWAPRGVSAVVLRPGDRRWTGSAGTTPPSLDDAVPIESITKSFTAALVLRAVDAGMIDLDDTVGALATAPWFVESTRVSYRELLSHHSGIAHYRSTPTWVDDPMLVDGWESALRAAHGIWRDPPEYSSTNYIVAALALEQRYGRPIEQLISEELLGPLGLDSASIDPPSPGQPNTGTAGIRASATDLARWATVLWRDGALFSASTADDHRLVDPVDLFGPGSVGMCPCWVDDEGVPFQAGIGYYGGTVLVRYDRVFDAVVVVSSAESIWDDGVAAAFTDLASSLARLGAETVRARTSLRLR